MEGEGEKHGRERRIKERESDFKGEEEGRKRVKKRGGDEERVGRREWKGWMREDGEGARKGEKRGKERKTGKRSS